MRPSDKQIAREIRAMRRRDEARIFTRRAENDVKVCVYPSVTFPTSPDETAFPDCKGYLIKSNILQSCVVHRFYTRPRDEHVCCELKLGLYRFRTMLCDPFVKR